MPEEQAASDNEGLCKVKHTHGQNFQSLNLAFESWCPHCKKGLCRTASQMVITYPKQVLEQAGDYGQLQCNRLHRERKKTENTKITIDVTHPDEVQENYFIGKNGSEMKHIQKDYEVKTYIHREFSAIQNFASAGEER